MSYFHSAPQSDSFDYPGFARSRIAVALASYTVVDRLQFHADAAQFDHFDAVDFDSLLSRQQLHAYFSSAVGYCGRCADVPSVPISFGILRCSRGRRAVHLCVVSCEQREFVSEETLVRKQYTRVGLDHGAFHDSPTGIFSGMMHRNLGIQMDRRCHGNVSALLNAALVRN